jgi:hypothetical protein
MSSLITSTSVNPTAEVNAYFNSNGIADAEVHTKAGPEGAFGTMLGAMGQEHAGEQNGDAAGSNAPLNVPDGPPPAALQNQDTVGIAVPDPTFAAIEQLMWRACAPASMQVAEQATKPPAADALIAQLPDVNGMPDGAVHDEMGEAAEATFAQEVADTAVPEGYPSLAGPSPHLNQNVLADEVTPGPATPSTATPPTATSPSGRPHAWQVSQLADFSASMAQGSASLASGEASPDSNGMPGTALLKEEDAAHGAQEAAETKSNADEEPKTMAHALAMGMWSSQAQPPVSPAVTSPAPSSEEDIAVAAETSGRSPTADVAPVMDSDENDDTERGDSMTQGETWVTALQAQNTPLQQGNDARATPTQADDSLSPVHEDSSLRPRGDRQAASRAVPVDRADAAPDVERGLAAEEVGNGAQASTEHPLQHVQGQGGATSFQANLQSAAQAQEATPTAPVPAAQASQELSAAIGQGARRVQMRVMPEGMGALDIQVQMTGREVHLSIRGDSMELAQTLSQGMRELRADLTSQGLTLGNMDFTAVDADSARGGAHSGERPASGREDANRDASGTVRLSASTTQAPRNLGQPDARGNAQRVIDVIL